MDSNQIAVKCAEKGVAAVGVEVEVAVVSITEMLWTENDLQRKTRAATR